MLVVNSEGMNVKQRNTFSIGWMIALSSWGLIFLTLVWGYIVFRFRATSWMNDSVTVRVQEVAIINTSIMMLSSLALSRGIKLYASRIWVWISFALGIGFLFGQMYLWKLILAEGLHWQTSIAGSFFFLLTGFHFLHVAGGLISLFILCLCLHQWQAKASSLIFGIKYFWDFLLIVWLILFVLIFIVK